MAWTDPKNGWDSISPEMRSALISGGVATIAIPPLTSLSLWADLLIAVVISQVASAFAYLVTRRRRARSSTPDSKG